jgi:protein SCO1/2
MKPVLGAWLTLLLAAPGGAQIVGQPAQPRIDWEQRLGACLPLEARFTDHEGRALTLGECFAGRPVVLALVYYECPMLCDLVFEGLISSLRALAHEPGEEFDLVALSIDPGETPELARAKLESCLESYGRSRAGWRFLVGAEDEIRTVADALGFGYSYVPERDEWAHAAGLTVLTPQGVVSRVLYGVEFAPRDLSFALIEASDGRVGTPVEKLLLRCFHYDPERGRYGFAILGSVRVLGLTTLGALGFFVLRWLRRERRGGAGETRREPGGPGAGLEPGAPS